MYKDIMIGDKQYEYFRLLKDEYKVFDTYFHVFACAAIIGCTCNRYPVEDTSGEGTESAEGRNRIPQSVLITNKNYFETIINLVTFIHYSRLDEKHILDNMFNDSDTAMMQKSEIAQQYAKGGIKILYDNIIGDKAKQADIIENCLSLIDGFNDQCKLDLEIKSLDELYGRFM